jgi:mannose-6-phosphate isomerase
MSFIALGSNQPADRFYRGGAKIRDLRGTAAPGDRVPEDWIASTTALFDQSAGLTLLGDGTTLAEAVADDPDYWLGAEHLEQYGIDSMVLVKLLDAGQRLPVHVHPDGDFARNHLDHAHGKAEAWVILEGGTVYLGFTRPVTDDELESWVVAQDVEAMLGSMHAVRVQAGDSVFVPPGMPHAIGEGIFLVEVQEPEDLSILLEWQGFALDGEADGHLGLGFDTALRAVDHREWTAAEIESIVVRGGRGRGTLAESSRRYFRAERFDVDTDEVLELVAGFAVLVVLGGSGSVSSSDGASTPLRRGDTILVPYAAGALLLSGGLSVVVCRPPAARVETVLA